MGAPVVHFEIIARDGKRAQEFYRTLFGWNIDSNNPMAYGLVTTGVKKGINGGVGQAEAGHQPYVTVYASVKNPQECLNKAVAMGARVVVPVTVIPNMVTYALFADPEGNLVGIVEDMPSPKAKAKSAPRRKRRASKVRKRRK